MKKDISFEFYYFIMGVWERQINIYHIDSSIPIDFNTDWRFREVPELRTQAKQL